jgi:hypothetical protein
VTWKMIKKSTQRMSPLVAQRKWAGHSLMWSWYPLQQRSKQARSTASLTVRTHRPCWPALPASLLLVQRLKQGPRPTPVHRPRHTLWTCPRRHKRTTEPAGPPNEERQPLNPVAAAAAAVAEALVLVRSIVENHHIRMTNFKQHRTQRRMIARPQLLMCLLPVSVAQRTKTSTVVERVQTVAVGVNQSAWTRILIIIMMSMAVVQLARTAVLTKCLLGSEKGNRMMQTSLKQPPWQLTNATTMPHSVLQSCYQLLPRRTHHR